jgi:SAM-dependent methyltransferase
MFKHIYVQKIIEAIGNSTPRIIELGCGRAEPIAPFVQARPSITYRGIEPYGPSYSAAVKNIGALPNVQLDNTFGYEIGADGSYDACFSLSTLEHVKQLERFLKQSIDAVKPGGLIVHHYDLGHALYPSSLKEKFQVWLGNTFPALLPEHKFVCYLDPQTVVALLEKNGAKVDTITYHQMPNHKKVLKNIDEKDPAASELGRQIVEWEFAFSPFTSSIPQKTREMLFPGIMVWAHKVK